MSLSFASRVQTDIALSTRTTLELGGAARAYAVARSEADVIDALEWARQQSMPVAILSGGSNLVVSDAGFDGLVIDLRSRGVAQRQTEDGVDLTAQAGEPWDTLVEFVVSIGLSGVECLSGIPGRVGATPIQNVGAYGQEVASVVKYVRVLEPSTGLVHELDAPDCGFAYRHSRFKEEPSRFIVLAVTISLSREAPEPPRYAELQRALADVDTPSLRQVRQTVLTLRRAKSMVLDANDPNRRSVGSFFTNPIVADSDLPAVLEGALALGVAKDMTDIPTYPATSGHTKLAAGWLIERAGFSKGLRRGAVGISSRHALGLVHHGGGTTQQLVELAREIQAGVQQRFGVMLRPEPVFLGFAQPPL